MSFAYRSRPKYTIIIPTRERADTLGHALRSVTREPNADLEIIVSDNASTDGTRAVVEAVHDSRIRYVNTGERVSMTANWEFGLSHATGEWVGFMGDDDAMVPGCLARLAEIIRQSDVEAVRCTPAAFTWPSLCEDGTGRLFVYLRRGVELRHGAEQLRRVMAGKAHHTSLPMIYNGGFARRSAIARARGADGRFFGSLIPDLYSAIALAHVVDRYAYCHEPLMINGASIHSTGVAQFSHREGAFSRFAAEPNMPFHPKVPLGPDGRIPKCLSALLLESYYQAQDRLDGLADIEPKRGLAARFRQWGEQARRAFPDYWRDATARDVLAASEIAGRILQRPRSRAIAVVRNLARVSLGG